MNKPSPAFRRAAALIAFAALCFGVALYWEQVCRFFSSAAAVFRPDRAGGRHRLLRQPAHAPL